MNFKLIYPRSPKTIDSIYSHSKTIDTFIYLFDRLLGNNIYVRGRKSFLVPPFNLMMLAALTPDDIDVEIVDERIGQINFEENVDLVGITCMTSDVTRAYDIADEFRLRGAKVLLGGIHPTVLPNEAAMHSDSVIIGEAERVLNDVFKDAQKGKLNKFYQSSVRHNLENLPIPRRDLIKGDYYITKNLIQTTRGCPHKCSFCSVNLISGSIYRRRPIDDVVNEIGQLDGRLIAFIDDNIVGNTKYSKQLFEALIPLNKLWYGNATASFGEEDKLLSIAAKSGCKILLIGFESFSKNALSGVKKHFNNSTNYHTIINRFHDHGIGIIGCFILGLDADNLDQFNYIIDFANSANLDAIQVSILTPYPGTSLFNYLYSSGRLLTNSWSDYDTTCGSIVFKPINMTTDELQSGYYKVYETLYNYRSIFKRLSLSKCFPSFFIPFNLRQRNKFIESKKRKQII